MSYIHYPETGRSPEFGSPGRAPHYPWLAFLFLTFSLFLTFHWPIEAQRTLDDYNMSQEDIAGGVAAGSAVRQVVLTILGIVALISLADRQVQRRLRIHGLLGWLLVSLAAWAWLSAIWAEDLALTIKRLVSFGILWIVAIAFVGRFSFREIRLWLFGTTALFLLISIVLEVLSGAFQPLAPGYRFSGTQHPNGEASECALLVLSALASFTMEKRRRWFFGASALFGFVFLILTASRTSLAATLFASAIYLTAVSSRKSKAMMVPFLGIFACLIILFVGAGLSQGLESGLLFGRDDASSVGSFAGRTDIWEQVGPYILERPILGYGYDGFWTPKHITVISDALKWGVPNSHSAYFDYLLSLGAVGLVLYLLSLFVGLFRIFSSFRLTRDPHFALLAALLISCMVDGSLESAIGEQTLLAFVSLMVLARLAFVPLEQARTIPDEPLWARPGLSGMSLSAPHS